MAFTEEEAAYLRSQPLARIATVGPDGQPDVTPVGFEFDGTYLYVGGHAPEDQEVPQRQGGPGPGRAGRRRPGVHRPVDAARPAGLRDDRADAAVRLFGPGAYMRITPAISWSWNLAGQPYGRGSGTRRTVHRG
jgi:pyridoxamine 5'-phosphate oxidase family protein